MPVVRSGGVNFSGDGDRAGGGTYIDPLSHGPVTHKACLAYKSVNFHSNVKFQTNRCSRARISSTESGTNLVNSCDNKSFLHSRDQTGSCHFLKSRVLS